MNALQMFEESALHLIQSFAAYLDRANSVARDIRHLVEDGDSRCTELAEKYLRITGGVLFNVQDLCARDGGSTSEPSVFPQFPSWEDLPTLLRVLDPRLRRTLRMILEDTLGNAVSPLCLMEYPSFDPQAPRRWWRKKKSDPYSGVQEEAVAVLKASVLRLLQILKETGQ